MDYNTIRDTFKNQVATKNAILIDFVINAIAKARRVAESEGEANYLMTKAVIKMVTPATNKNKLTSNYNNDPFWKLHGALLRLVRGYFPQYWNNVFLSLEKKQVMDDAKKLMDATQRHYLYIFVRQDICPEQQAVQAAHATFVAGAQINNNVLANAVRPKKFDPKSTHFVLIGVPDLNALYQARGIAHLNCIETHDFYEEDIGDQLTAFTTGIVTQEKRNVFKQFGLLKFKKEA